MVIAAVDRFDPSVDRSFGSIDLVDLVFDPSVDRSIGSIDSVDAVFEETLKVKNATFGRIKPIVPGFFRIGFRFERVPGRSA